MKNQKQDSGKLKYNLVPFDALDDIVDVLTKGEIKYGSHNWLKDSGPEDIHRYEAALLRHMSEHMQGRLVDKESGSSHIAHVACNALFILSLQKKFNK